MNAHLSACWNQGVDSRRHGVGHQPHSVVKLPHPDSCASPVPIWHRVPSFHFWAQRCPLTGGKPRLRRREQQSLGICLPLGASEVTVVWAGMSPQPALGPWTPQGHGDERQGPGHSQP